MNASNPWVDAWALSAVPAPSAFERLHRRHLERLAAEAAEELVVGLVEPGGVPALDPLRGSTHDQTMTRDTLLDIDNRRPFVPYSLRLNNGDVIRIEQPEHCLVTEDGQTLVFNEGGGKLKFVAVRNITLVE